MKTKMLLMIMLLCGCVNKPPTNNENNYNTKVIRSVIMGEIRTKNHPYGNERGFFSCEQITISENKTFGLIYILDKNQLKPDDYLKFIVKKPDGELTIDYRKVDELKMSDCFFYTTRDLDDIQIGKWEFIIQYNYKTLSETSILCL